MGKKMCCSHRFVNRNERKEKKKGWGFMQAALAEFPHTSLVTPNIANLHRFKAVADMKYSAVVLLLQHTVEGRKKNCARSPCTLLILNTWWLLVQIGLALHSRSGCLWYRGCIFNELPPLKKERKKSHEWGAEWKRKIRRERDTERGSKSNRLENVCVCVCVADSSLALQMLAGPEQSWAGSLLKALHLHSRAGTTHWAWLA